MKIFICVYAHRHGIDVGAARTRVWTERRR